MNDSTVESTVSRLWQAAGSLFSHLAWLDQIRLERKALGKLSDRDFQDMGIDRATAINESARGYFDAPRTRATNPDL